MSHDNFEVSLLQDDIKDRQNDITAYERQAIEDTKSALQQIEHVRDDYSHGLQTAEAKVRADGYDLTQVGAVDGHETETPDQAERDVHDALGGNQDSAARVNNVLSSITPEQLAGKVPLTPEQASVLSQLQAQEHGMSIDALNNAEQRLGDQRRMIGDFWQLMSNQNLTFPMTPLTVGAKQGSDMLKGGAEQLPDSVQEVLNAPTWVMADQTKTIANIVKDGNPELQRNTAIDQGLLHKSAQIMSQFSWSRDTYDPTVEAVFAAAGRDHAAVNWMLNPHASADESDKNFLQYITHHAWSDSGDAAGSLFSWTKDATGPEAQIAGQAAHAYATYLGQDSNELLHLPGNHTLGQIDPKLTQAFADGLAPYVSDIAGAKNDLSQFFAAPDAQENIGQGKFPLAKGIFSVLSTDKTAAQIFGGAAMQQIIQDQNRYAGGIANYVPGAEYTDAPLEHAATLRALINSGLGNAVAAEGINKDQQAAEAYSRKQSIYGSVVKGLGTAAGVGGKALPPPYDLLGKLAGPAVNMASKGLEQDIIGPPRTPSANPDTGLQTLPEGSAYRPVLDGLIANHVPINALPEGFLRPVNPGDPNSPLRIATLEEVTGLLRYQNLDVYGYDNILSAALRGTIDNDPTTAIESHMEKHYNDARN